MNTRHINGAKYYSFENGAWVHTTNANYTLNTAGQAVQTDTEEWNVSSGTYSKSHRTTFTYNPAGHNTLALVQVWNAAGTALTNSSRTTRVPDASGRVLFNGFERWNTTSAAWQPETEQRYSYFSDGTLATYSRRTWDLALGAWENQDSTSSTWFAPGRNSSNTRYRWDAGSSRWVLSIRSRSFLNSAGQDSCSISESYISSSSTWRLNSRSYPAVRTNTTDGYETLVNTEDWDANSASFVPAYRVVNKYNNSDQLVWSHDEYMRTGSWELTTLYRYYFEPFDNVGVPSIPGNAGMLRLTLSPNPAREMAIVKLDWKLPQEFTAVVTDLSGRILQRYAGSQTTGTIAIEASGLPAGNYLIGVQGARGGSASTMFSVR